MSNEKFTKGEWFAKKDGAWFQDERYQLDSDYGGFSWVMVGCNDKAVAIVVDYGRSESQLDHNAHLIASAPEMYEMLMACSEILKQCDLHNTSRDVDNLLAKARGES